MEEQLHLQALKTKAQVRETAPWLSSSVFTTPPLMLEQRQSLSPVKRRQLLTRNQQFPPKNLELKHHLLCDVAGCRPEIALATLTNSVLKQEHALTPKHGFGERTGSELQGQSLTHDWNSPLEVSGASICKFCVFHNTRRNSCAISPRYLSPRPAQPGGREDDKLCAAALPILDLRIM